MGLGRRAFARAAGAAGIALCAGAFAASCTKTDEIGFVLKLPADVRDSVNWLEVAAYRTDTCPSITQMNGGLPRGIHVARVAFERGAAAPRMKLPEGRYAFAATARNTQCEVLASGCTQVEVPDGDEIAIDLRTSSVRGGKCEPGAACRNAECLPALGTDTPGVGCTLEVLGAGPLSRLDGTDVAATRPAIAATSDGFVIAHSQANGAASRLTTMKVGFNGGPLAASPTVSLPYHPYEIGAGACAEDGLAGGVGLSFVTPDAPSGLLVWPRAPSCNSDLFRIALLDRAGRATGEIKAVTPDPSARPRTQVLSNRALAPGGYLARVIDGQANLTTITAEGETPGAMVAVGHAGPHRLAWVTANSEAVAVLTQTEGDGAGEGGVGPELRLQISTLKPAPIGLVDVEPPLRGNFASLAIEDHRIVVVSSGSLTDPLQFHLLDIGSAQMSSTTLDGLADLGPPNAADVVTYKGRMFVAAVLSKGVSVVAYDGFGTPKPTFIAARALEKEPRVGLFMGGVYDELRDGYVAVAAHEARVGVVWVTGQRIKQGEELGGWAVLACR